MKWLISCGLVVTWVTLVLGRCNFPPSVWCSSAQIAKECGVYKQCEEWNSQSGAAAPVNLTLYYESLCPDCQNFMKTQLINTWTALGDDLLTVLNLELVPYGNAREQKVEDKWIFTCQHGTQECIGNRIDTCAIALLKNITVYFPFIFCMEKSRSQPADAAKQCADKLGISIDPIMNCANSAMGDNLEHLMAQKTDALNPPHKYVPWVTLNGVHTEKIEKEAEEDLLKLVCQAYKGPKVPACDQMKARTCLKIHP